MKKQDSRTVDAVVRMLSVVKALEALDGARVAEVGNAVGLPDSTVYRYLATLYDEEFVVKEGDEYRLGAKFLNIGQAVQRRNRRYGMIEAKVTELANETGELVQFAVEEHGYGRYVFRTKGDHAVTTDLDLGEAFYLHTTAVGKAILSQLPQHRVEEIIERRGLPPKTEETIVTPDTLRSNLNEIRERGVSFNNDERIMGLRAVAAPITTEHGYFLGAITIAGPKKRMKGDVFRDHLPDLLLGMVNELEINLTYAID